jgi:hypothetical protein
MVKRRVPLIKDCMKFTALVETLQADFDICRVTAIARIKDSLPPHDFALGPKRYWKIATYERWKEGLLSKAA